MLLNSKQYPISYTFIFTGMRRGELFGSEWSDVDWVNSKIHVRRSLWRGNKQNPKAKYSKRTIDAGPGLMEILRTHKAKQNEIRLKAGQNWQDNNLIFCRDDGSPIDPDNYYHWDHKAILKRAGLRHMPIHSLRHTFASILIAAGHSLKYIQKQMGHGSIKIMMNLYGHLMPESIKDAVKKQIQRFLVTKR